MTTLTICIGMLVRLALVVTVLVLVMASLDKDKRPTLKINSRMLKIRWPERREKGPK